jgi:hypothetical protein
MQISANDLKRAVKAKLITEEQANKLVEFLMQGDEEIPSFRLTHVLYYFGGFLAIAAVSLFVTQAWNLLLGWPLFILSSLFFILGLLMMRYFLNLQLRLPAGIMATFSLVIVPLAIYNLQAWLGYLPKTNYNYADYNYVISWSWLPMELATLLAGIIMFYFYRFPFLLFPIAITLWYMSMDLYAMLYHLQEYNWDQRANFSLCFGLIILFYALYVDIRHSDEKEDYAFWLYLFGVMAFWGGLSSQSSNSELSHFIYCMINIAMILISVFLNRRVFAVFGALGVLGYLSYLSFSVFKGSLAFPVLLVFLGIFIILIATRWAKMENKLYLFFKPYIPSALLTRRLK